MPEEGGDQEPAANNHEEQEASYEGCMLYVRHEGVQNRQGIDLPFDGKPLSVPPNVSIEAFSPLLSERLR
jgi:hypothetical protein